MSDKPGITLPKPMMCRPADTSILPSLVRYSTALRHLRDGTKKGSDAAEALERDFAEHGSRCTVHGLLEDPIIVLLRLPEDDSERVGFGCPDCSGPEVKARWEAEGNPEWWICPHCRRENAGTKLCMMCFGPRPGGTGA